MSDRPGVIVPAFFADAQAALVGSGFTLGYPAHHPGLSVAEYNLFLKENDCWPLINCDGDRVLNFTSEELTKLTAPLLGTGTVIEMIGLRVSASTRESYENGLKRGREEGFRRVQEALGITTIVDALKDIGRSLDNLGPR